MLIRYSSVRNGKQRKVAKVFTREEHRINPSLIDPKAAMIVRRLREGGHEAYIVGGAVRDTLVGREPKDFDIATSAHPRQIKKLFWNSRIIGRRFKLVHIHYPDKIFEVSTFRARENGEGENNLYGTIEEDAWRRDFSINALFYDPLEEQVIDYVDGMRDIRNRVIRSIIPLDSTFLEDPVRMIRGIKYASVTGFTMKFSLRRAIRRHSRELARVSSSRMTEEVFKMLASGSSQNIVRMMLHKQLFCHILPVLDELLQSGKQIPLTTELLDSLSELDKGYSTPEGIEKQRMIVALVRPFLLIPEEYESTMELFRELFTDIKRLIHPITPPNIDVEKAVALILEEEQIKVPKHAVRKPKAPPAKPQGRRDTRRRKGPPRHRKKPAPPKS